MKSAARHSVTLKKARRGDQSESAARDSFSLAFLQPAAAAYRADGRGGGGEAERRKDDKREARHGGGGGGEKKERWRTRSVNCDQAAGTLLSLLSLLLLPVLSFSPLSLSSQRKQNSSVHRRRAAEREREAREERNGSRYGPSHAHAARL